MNLHNAIQSLNSTIFDTEGFAETVEYWPLGVEANRFEVSAIVDQGDIEGNNQVKGDGRAQLNADSGRAIRRSIEVDLPLERMNDAGECVAVVVSDSGKDRILVTRGEQSLRYNVKRVIGTDEAVQTILAVQPTEYAAQMNQGRRG